MSKSPFENLHKSSHLLGHTKVIAKDFFVNVNVKRRALYFNAVFLETPGCVISF